MVAKNETAIGLVAKNETRRILDALEGIRKRRGWGASGLLDRKLQRCEGYMSRVIGGAIGLRLELLFEAVEALGFKAGEFFAWVYGDECRISPKRYLLNLEKGEKDELLRRADVLIGSAKSTTLEGPKSSEASEVLVDAQSLDELRFSYPLRAREEGLRLLKSIVMAGDVSVDAVALCATLAALGSVERTLNRYPLSAAYLRRALELAHTHDLAGQEAEILQRCCYLVADQGDLSGALALASQARDRYTLLHDLVGIGKCLVDQGIFHRESGHTDRVISCLESALSYLPPDLWQSRVTAYIELGWVYLSLGKLDTAQGFLDRAYREHRVRNGYSWWKMSWLRGELALARERLEEAETAFVSVREVLAAHDNSVDVALVSLRIMKIFLLSGRMSEFKTLVSDMLLLLEPLRLDNAIAASVVSDIARKALAGKVTLDFLDRAHTRLRKASEQRVSSTA